MSEHIKKMYTDSMTLRGIVLDSTVSIERRIDEYLSDYFCKNNVIGNELKEMLWYTERITLGGKKDIFFMLIKRDHKEFLKSHPKFITTLEEIIPHRNIFAHLEVDLLTEQIHNESNYVQIAFKKYKNGKLTPQKYRKEDIEKLAADFAEIETCIEELIKTNKAP